MDIRIFMQEAEEYEMLQDGSKGKISAQSRAHFMLCIWKQVRVHSCLPCCKVVYCSVCWLQTVSRGTHHCTWTQGSERARHCTLKHSGPGARHSLVILIPAPSDTCYNVPELLFTEECGEPFMLSSLFLILSISSVTLRNHATTSKGACDSLCSNIHSQAPHPHS